MNARDLNKVPVSQWTEDEAFEHLKQTFTIAFRTYPDVMEPWVVRADNIWADRKEATDLIRRALMATLKDRHPAKERTNP